MGLIEVLIAVLVLSIGLLGLAALQTRALGNSGSTGVQTMATISSYSILEAMRLDKANALLGRYDGTVTASSCPDPGTSLATYQINAWCVQLGKALGAVSSTQGTVACKAVGTCEVKVQFDNSKATGGSSTQTVVTEAAL